MAVSANASRTHRESWPGSVPRRLSRLVGAPDGRRQHLAAARTGWGRRPAGPLEVGRAARAARAAGRAARRGDAERAHEATSAFLLHRFELRRCWPPTDSFSSGLLLTAYRATGTAGGSWRLPPQVAHRGVARRGRVGLPEVSALGLRHVLVRSEVVRDRGSEQGGDQQVEAPTLGGGQRPGARGGKSRCRLPRPAASVGKPASDWKGAQNARSYWTASTFRAGLVGIRPAQDVNGRRSR
jgi:hypothetical protein